MKNLKLKVMEIVKISLIIIALVSVILYIVVSIRDANELNDEEMEQ